MKALVVGAAGFVGKHLVDHLLEIGWDVSATQLGTESMSTRIPMYELDILEPHAISSVLSATTPDFVFHLAAQSSVPVSWEQPGLTVDVNIKGGVNLLESIRVMQKPPRVLLIGSGEEYGSVAPNDIPIKESIPLRPSNIYAATKVAQGLIGQIYSKAYDLEVIIIRAFNHVGPGQSDAFVLPNFSKQVALIEAGIVEPVLRVGNLDAKRDFTDVRDIVRAYRLLAEKGISGEIYNVGSGKAISINELSDMILSLAKLHISKQLDFHRLRPADIPVYEADVSKLVMHTNWKPEIPMIKTLSDILDEWRGKVSNNDI